ncbi:hypothetical protein [Reticulibacter mediterranei]|uniref:hypothetical protein n=1 Tax=Reticulibacter mediterranei TaxID=2778369 RepID=UPI001C68C0CB|nr:hypothetical protein [Reticulibacter mediterranei]
MKQQRQGLDPEDQQPSRFLCSRCGKRVKERRPAPGKKGQWLCSQCRRLWHEQEDLESTPGRGLPPLPITT